MQRPHPYAGYDYDAGVRPPGSSGRPPLPPQQGPPPGVGARPRPPPPHNAGPSNPYPPPPNQQQGPMSYGPYAAGPPTGSVNPLPPPSFSGPAPIRLGARTSVGSDQPQHQPHMSGGRPPPGPPYGYSPGPGSASGPPDYSLPPRPPIRLDGSGPPPQGAPLGPPPPGHYGPPPPQPYSAGLSAAPNSYLGSQQQSPYDPARRSASHDPYATARPSDNNSFQGFPPRPLPPYHDGPPPPPGPGPGPSEPPSYGQYSGNQHSYGMPPPPPPPPGAGGAGRGPGPDRHNHRDRDRGDRGKPYSRPGGGSSAGSDSSRRQAPSSIDRNDPRTADEKPCRTLFVRNIDNSTPTDAVRDHFARFGEIKSFFELISKRGLCFITYFDLRAAEWAKGESHAKDFFGNRQLDVHFSLPKDADTSKRCDREQNQGTLFVLLKRYPAAWSDDDFGREFSRFGEVSSVRRYKDQKNARFLEYFDSRACVLAHDSLGGTEYRDASGQAGEWDVKFAWDANMVQKAGGVTSEVPSGGAGKRGRGGGGDDYGRNNKRGRDGNFGSPDSGYRNRGPPPPIQAQGMYGGPPPTYAPNGHDPRQAVTTPQQATWGGASGNPYAASTHQSTQQQAPPQYGGSPGGSNEDQSRREQAQKVQQLLASLGGKTSSDASPPVRPPPWSPEAPNQQPTPQIPHRGGGELPSNVASLLGGGGAGSTAGAATNDAQNAQQSIAQMLSLLQQQGGGSGGGAGKSR